MGKYRFWIYFAGVIITVLLFARDYPKYIHDRYPNARVDTSGMVVDSIFPAVIWPISLPAAYYVKHVTGQSYIH